MNGSGVRRSRARYALLLAVVVVLGLASRIYRGSIPRLVDLYAGDTLWAAAVVLLLAIVFPLARTRSLILWAAALSLAVELSQLAHPAWLDSLRQVPGVALAIGYDFVWVDLACYATGVLIGGVIDAVTSEAG